MREQSCLLPVTRRRHADRDRATARGMRFRKGDVADVVAQHRFELLRIEPCALRHRPAKPHGSQTVEPKLPRVREKALQIIIRPSAHARGDHGSGARPREDVGEQPKLKQSFHHAQVMKAPGRSARE